MSANNKKPVTEEMFNGNVSPLVFNNVGIEPTEVKYSLDIDTANRYLLEMVRSILGDVESAKFRFYPRSEGKEVETSGKSTTLRSETVAEVVISLNNPHFITRGSKDDDDIFVTNRRRKDYDDVLIKFLKDFGIGDDAPDTAKSSTAKRSVYTMHGESKILLLEPLKVLGRFFDDRNYGYQDAFGKNASLRQVKIGVQTDIGTRGDMKGKLIGYTVYKTYRINKAQTEYSIFKPGKNRDDDDYQDRGNREDRRRGNRNDEYRKNYDTEGNFRDKNNDREKYIKE